MLDNDLSRKTFSLESGQDLIEIRKYGRSLATKVEFSPFSQTLIATALSEICRNVIEHAGSGEVIIGVDKEEVPPCITVTVKDNGPGIENLKKALQEGFSEGKGFGIGLSGTKRIMDEFDVQLNPNGGTTVKMCKYLEK